MRGAMSHRVMSSLALIGFAILMAVRSELSSIAGRSVLAGIAFSLGGIALYCIVKARVDRRPREKA
jgi:hypothetical protein